MFEPQGQDLPDGPTKNIRKSGKPSAEWYLKQSDLETG